MIDTRIHHIAVLIDDGVEQGVTQVEHVAVLSELVGKIFLTRALIYAHGVLRVEPWVADDGNNGIRSRWTQIEVVVQVP